MKVLLTRRREDGQRSGERFRTAGFDPVFLPLFERVKTGKPMPGGPHDFCLFTSAAAVGVLEAMDHDQLRDMPAYAVGPRTAEILQGKAYKNIRQGGGHADKLAEMIRADSDGRAWHGLYVCGEKQSFDFPAAFSQSRVTLDLWEVYRSRKIDPGHHALNDALTTAKDGLIALYSPGSTIFFLELVHRHDAFELLDTFRFLVISDRCSAELPREFRDRTLVAPSPDEEGMLAAAGPLLPHRNQP